MNFDELNPACIEVIRELVMCEYGDAIKRLRAIDDDDSAGQRAHELRCRIEACAQIIGKLPVPGRVD